MAPRGTAESRYNSAMQSDPTPPQESETPAQPLAAAATVHEAELASGFSGIVYWGAAIDFTAAAVRRHAGENVVVRGTDLKTNRALAERIEATVGPYKRGTPHTMRAGPHALPHFQQVDPNHQGHCFYETANRRARKKP
jgi:hypothetical protein